MADRERTAMRVALVVAAWLVVVGAGSWLVWTVISQVGDGYVGNDTGLPAGGRPSATPPSATSTGTAPVAPTTAASPSARSKTWTGSPGVVTTRCSGSRIELVGAAASSDGYLVEVKERGPEVVEVEFEGRGDETVLETRVEARCSGGVPRYAVGSDD